MSTTETLRRPSPSIDARLGGLVDADSEAIEALERLAMGAKVKAEIEALWQIYTGRRVGRTIHYGDTITEERVLATRYYDESGIEELYRLEDITSCNAKYWQQRAEVLIYSGDSQWRIRVDEHDVLTVIHYSPDGQQRICDQAEAAQCVDDFQYRSLIAAERHRDRAKLQQRAADQDALHQVTAQFPVLAMYPSATE